MSSGKKRLVIPITLQFGIRYYLRSGLLEQLEDAIQPLILLAWSDSQLEEEFRSISAEVYHLPKQQWGSDYRRIRNWLDIWHRSMLQSPSTAIDERRWLIDMPLRNKVIRKTRQALVRASLVVPRNAERLLESEQRVLLEDSNYAEFEKLIRSLKADALLSLAPFHRDEEMLVRAAHNSGLPMCTAIHSFDNLTTRGWIPPVFDTYLVWNSYNAGELSRIYPSTRNNRVEIVGTPQFDFYLDPGYLWPREKWLQELSLPCERPLILFGGGPPEIVPHEPFILQQIDNAVENEEIRGNPVILFRRHPVDRIERWKPVIDSSRHIICDDPWLPGESIMHFNIRRTDMERLVSTLYHTQVHVNTSSTMTVDGAFFDKPQIGPAYDDCPGQRYDRTTKELYLREHYLPITNSGGLTVANSREELIMAINEGLENPQNQQEGRRKIIREICTFDDGSSTRRVEEAIRRFVNESRHASDTSTQQVNQN